MLIVDKDEQGRRSLSAALEQAGYEIREAATGEEALRAVREDRPAVVVLEVSLPDISGYSVCRQLREDFGDELPIIFVSADRTESFDRMAGLLIGADEYLAKPCPSDEFVWRIRRLIPRSELRPAEWRGVSELTEREREILRLLARGLRQKQIAQELYLSPKTVNSHIARIYEKLGVHSRTEALHIAFRSGLVDVAQ